jgi:hypothetical protein
MLTLEIDSEITEFRYELLRSLSRYFFTLAITLSTCQTLAFLEQCPRARSFAQALIAIRKMKLSAQRWFELLAALEFAATFCVAPPCD